MEKQPTKHMRSYNTDQSIKVMCSSIKIKEDNFSKPAEKKLQQIRFNEQTRAANQRSQKNNQ